jgi:hypothetical protein
MGLQMPNTKWSEPPRIKILEAAGAVFDGRVHLTGDGAIVTSSSGGKAYTVRYDATTNALTSNDNGSYYVGYLGYPSIAFLFASNRLQLSPDIANLVAGVPWKELNSRLRNNYQRVESELLASATPTERAEVDAFLNTSMERIGGLDIRRLTDSSKPPDGW